MIILMNAYYCMRCSCYDICRAFVGGIKCNGKKDLHVLLQNTTSILSKTSFHRPCLLNLIFLFFFFLLIIIPLSL